MRDDKRAILESSRLATTLLKDGEPLLEDMLTIVRGRIDDACGLLKGRGEFMQAYVLAELAAIFVASHKADTVENTNALREEIFEQWAALVADLVPIVAKERGIDPP